MVQFIKDEYEEDGRAREMRGEMKRKIVKGMIDDKSNMARLTPKISFVGRIADVVAKTRLNYYFKRLGKYDEPHYPYYSTKTDASIFKILANQPSLRSYAIARLPFFFGSENQHVTDIIIQFAEIYPDLRQQAMDALIANLENVYTLRWDSIEKLTEKYPELRKQAMDAIVTNYNRIDSDLTEAIKKLADEATTGSATSIIALAKILPGLCQQSQQAMDALATNENAVPQIENLAEKYPDLRHKAMDVLETTLNQIPGDHYFYVDMVSAIMSLAEKYPDLRKKALDVFITAHKTQWSRTHVWFHYYVSAICSLGEKYPELRQPAMDALLATSRDVNAIASLGKKYPDLRQQAMNALIADLKTEPQHDFDGDITDRVSAIVSLAEQYQDMAQKTMDVLGTVNIRENNYFMISAVRRLVEHYPASPELNGKAKLIIEKNELLKVSPTIEVGGSYHDYYPDYDDVWLPDYGPNPEYPETQTKIEQIDNKLAQFGRESAISHRVVLTNDKVIVLNVLRKYLNPELKDAPVVDISRLLEEFKKQGADISVDTLKQINDENLNNLAYLSGNPVLYFWDDPEVFGLQNGEARINSKSGLAAGPNESRGER